MLDRFEATTGDVVAAAGANVVKRIGDAVMFVTNAPGIACTLAHRSRRGVRGRRACRSCASAWRSATSIVRHGDFYGPTVNLAARLVAAAEPGTVLADAALHGRLGRDARPRTRSCPRAGSRSPGSTTPVEAFQLLRDR